MENGAETNTLEEIDIIGILKDVLREWWVILLFGLTLALLADVWVEKRYTPEYTTKTTLAVSGNGVNGGSYQNLKTTKELAGKLSTILNSNILKQKVADDLNMDKLRATAQASQIPETNLLEIQVTADSAMESYQVMQSILENYDSVTNYALTNVILQTLQPPAIPGRPSNSMNTKKYVIMGFLAGAFLAALYVIFFSYFRDTVKSEKEVAKKIDAKHIGTIYHEDKGGRKVSAKKASMLVENPLRSFRFVESSRMAASKVRHYMDRENAKVLMVTSVMENEGKSTVAANIALSIAQENKKVLLIDCDFRKPAQFRIFGKKEKETTDLRKVLDKAQGVNGIIEQWKDTSLYMVLNAAPVSVNESMLLTPVIRVILDFCKNKMDYIILDTSPMALVADAEEVAQMADASVLVIKEKLVLTKDINDAVDILNNTKGKVLGCILNNASTGFSSNTGHYGYGSRYAYGGHYGKQR